jgi:hypothetical protein
MDLVWASDSSVAACITGALPKAARAGRNKYGRTLSFKLFGDIARSLGSESGPAKLLYTSSASLSTVDQSKLPWKCHGPSKEALSLIVTKGLAWIDLGF